MPLPHLQKQMANWGSLWFRKMAHKNFGKDASNLWSRIWFHSLPQQNKWQCVQEAMQICWNPLDEATQVFFKLMAPPSPPSFSLPFLLSIPPFHNFLFCFLLLTRIIIFWWRNVSRKNHPSWRDWTPDSWVTDEGLTHWASGNCWS